MLIHGKHKSKSNHSLEKSVWRKSDRIEEGEDTTLEGGFNPTLPVHGAFKSKTNNVKLCQHFYSVKTQMKNVRGGRRQSMMVALSPDSPTLTGARNYTPF